MLAMMRNGGIDMKDMLLECLILETWESELQIKGYPLNNSSKTMNSCGAFAAPLCEDCRSTYPAKHLFHWRGS